MKTVPDSKYSEYLNCDNNNLCSYGPTLADGNQFVPDVAAFNNIRVLKNGIFLMTNTVDDTEYIVVDVNGSKSPNEVGEDIFYFDVNFEIKDNDKILLLSILLLLSLKFISDIN